MRHQIFFSNVMVKFSNLRFKSTGLCSFKDSKISCDIAVIGGGIIGTSVARKLKQTHNDLEVVLFEKECALAKHQSSHNSGVIHSGVYYKPGSIKAKLCVEGANLLQTYCSEKGVPVRKVGKIILALNNDQVRNLEILYRRGKDNGLKNLYMLPSLCDIKKVCPECRGDQAIWLPDVSIVNFKDITFGFAEDFKLIDGKIIFNFKVNKIEFIDNVEYPIMLISSDDQIVRTKYLILCGGLQSEYLTKLVSDKDFRKSKQKFMTVRAEYLTLDTQYSDEVNINIYKVPNLDLPFLHAHLTPRLDSRTLLGPWVVPSLTHDSYECSDINVRYVRNLVTFSGFQNMIIKNFCTCFNQVAKDICSDLRVKELQEMIPNLPYQHLEKSPVALQSLLLNSDGTFVDDFVFNFFNGAGSQSRTINLQFTPSPAATACLAIANFVQKEFAQKLCN